MKDFINETENNFIYLEREEELIEALKEINNPIFNEIIDYLESIPILKNRINDLNTILGEISRENEELKFSNEDLINLNKKLKNENLYLKVVNNFGICKYTPYMISEIIKELYNIEISSHRITSIAENNNFFDNEHLALRILRQKNNKQKYSSTVIFSLIGIVKVIDIVKSIIVTNIDKMIEKSDSNNKEPYDIDKYIDKMKNGIIEDEDLLHKIRSRK